jgi:hypothetical protein
MGDIIPIESNYLVYKLKESIRMIKERKHAATFDRVIAAEGHIEAEREFHYLTCKKCHVENDSNALALKISKLLRPDDWPRVKYLVEGILREYLENGTISGGGNTPQNESTTIQETEG